MNEFYATIDPATEIRTRVDERLAQARRPMQPPPARRHALALRLRRVADVIDN